MPLVIKEWGKAGFTNWQSGPGLTPGLGITLPFDSHFKADDPLQDNHIPLSKVGRPVWYVYVSFPPLNPEDPNYPHYVEIHDNDYFVTLKFGSLWSEAASLERGEGPMPTDVRKHHVRLVLLNKDKKPLLSQSGDYYVDPG